MKFIVKRDHWTLREADNEKEAWDEAFKLSETNPTMVYEVVRVQEITLGKVSKGKIKWLLS